MNEPLTADSPVFRDGLGDRLPAADPQGRRLELLQVSADLQASPAFELALRERAAALASFANPAFPRVHRVGAIAGSSATLGVLSDRPEGTRLSSLLARAAAGELDTTPRVAVAVLRQLVPAVDALCRHAPGLAHGALAPERLIVAPDGRLHAADAVFGSALERLNLSRRELWRGFRIAIPPAAGPVRIDERADVTALGVIALALLLTRPVGDDEYPSRVATLAREVVDLWVLRGRPAPPAVAAWVTRALQSDARTSFATMADAHAALAQTPAWQIDEASARCVLAAWASGETVAREARRSQRIRLAATNGVPAPPPPVPAPEPAAAVEPASPVAALPAPVPVLRPAEDRAPAPPPVLRVFPLAPQPGEGRRWRWALASAAGLIVLGLLGFALTGGHLPWAAAAKTGTLAIDSIPAGAEVLVDGERRGVTPAELALEEGAHTVDLRVRGGQRTLSVTIVAGQQVSQRVTLRPAPRPSPARSGAGAVAAAGWLAIEAPFPLELRERDASLGVLKSGRIPLSPGRHAIEVLNASLGFRQTRLVQIVAGRPTTLPIEVPFGTVHVNATPWAQVWIDGTQVGDTPLGDLSVPIGPHEFWFRNPQLGEKRYAVSVTLTQPLYLTVDMRPQ